MTYSLTDVIVVPFCRFLMDGEAKGMDAKKFIGTNWSYREAFRMAYNSLDADSKLEALSHSKKLELWNESLLYCPNDRLNYCKAIHFYYLATK
jgi:uncharacterized protein YbaR (Trm112 family)